MRRPARLVTVILALGGPFACGGESGSRGDGPGVEVRDSAGVEIVLNHGAGSSPIAITESLRIGALEGPEEEQLFRVRPPVVGEDGSIYVPLLGTGEIRVFSGDGTHLHTTGRPGDGPGEFRGLSRAYLSGDDLVALDMAAYRVTVFDPDGTVKGTVPLPRDDALGFTTPAARFGGGWLLQLPVQRGWPGHGELRDVVTRLAVVSGVPDVLEAIRQVEAGPSELRPLADVVWTRSLGMDQAGVQTGQRRLWESVSSWDTDGTALFVTAGDAYQVDVLDGTGAVVRRIRRDHEPVPITDAMRRAFIDHVIRHHDTVEVRTEFGTDPVAIQRFRLDASTQAHLPALGRIVVGTGGQFLVERPDLVDDPVASEWAQLEPQASRWDWFDGGGRFLGTATFPPRFSPWDLDGDAVVGIHRDELGVEYVVRYRMTPGGS